MKKSKFVNFFLLLSVSFFSILPGTRADTGPKPAMEFAFDQASLANPLTIVSGILYECQQPDCSDAQPLEQLGAQGFGCGMDSCSARAYGFAPYHKIEIEFSDGKTRQSNIFKTAGFESRYRVTVNQDDLSVQTLPSLPAPRWMLTALLIFACVVCGGVLLIVGIVLLILRFLRK